MSGNPKARDMSLSRDLLEVLAASPGISNRDLLERLNLRILKTTLPQVRAARSRLGMRAGPVESTAVAARASARHRADHIGMRDGRPQWVPIDAIEIREDHALWPPRATELRDRVWLLEDTDQVWRTRWADIGALERLRYRCQVGVELDMRSAGELRQLERSVAARLATGARPRTPADDDREEDQRKSLRQDATRIARAAQCASLNDARRAAGADSPAAGAARARPRVARRHATWAAVDAAGQAVAR